MSQDDQGGRLPRRFMGPDALTDLLAIAGSRFDADGAWVVLSTAHREGRTAGEAIPALFDGEPRISSPDHARLLYGNLLALWDFLEAGLTPPLGPDAGETAAPPPRPRATPAPEPFGEATPDAPWIERAWQHLEDDAKSRTRLQHIFENRQDPLLEALDAAGLSDPGYAVARFLVFELFAFLELGRPGQGRTVDGRALERPVPEGSPPPPALSAYVEESLLEAADEDEAPSEAELAQVRELSHRALSALCIAYGGFSQPSERTS
ncbi:MAG TPA: hypothetical protein VK013_01280 [Myxococcaceae bacterium]|nr:hypothetical protein [Myxococcaceae bacterium]